MNDKVIELKQFDENLFESTQPFTESKRIEMNEWNNFDNFKLEISQAEPLSLHIAALVTE